MAIDADSLADKVFLLAGATGALGAELTGVLRRGGAKLAVAVRRPWQVDKVRQQLGSDGVLVGCVPALDSEAAAGFVKGAADALGPIDALLCAAGAFAAAPIGKDPQDQLRGLLEANLLVGATLARAVVGPMIRRRTGALVFVGSAAVGSAGSSVVNYLASKAALAEWVRALAHELDGTGVRAAALLPGTLDTAANREAMPDADRSQWVPVAQLAEAMIRCAVAAWDGTAGAGTGPLYPVPAAH
jgi:NAD(P)-dependent dehydrogenase (short-subunit alcohol dehydrogenase family)